MTPHPDLARSIETRVLPDGSYRWTVIDTSIPGGFHVSSVAPTEAEAWAEAQRMLAEVPRLGGAS